jgi:hypothetical protein
MAVLHNTVSAITYGVLSSPAFLNMEQTPAANSQTLIYFLSHFLVFRFRVNFKCGTRIVVGRGYIRPRNESIGGRGLAP